MVPDPMARYKQLLFYASKLPPMPAADHLESHKVQGCVSQVWIKPELQPQGTIQWQADSDSQLTKGLAALLVLGLSGCTPQEVLSIQPEFIEMLGLKQSLTPSRNNGFLNAFKLMQLKCLGLLGSTAPDADTTTATASAASPAATASTPAPVMAVAASASSTSSSNNSSHTEKVVGGGGQSHPSVATLERPVSSPVSVGSSSSAAVGGAATASSLDGSSSHVSGGMDSADCATATAAAAKAARANGGNSSSSRTPIADSIRDKLNEALQPSQMQVIDQSASHAGHAAMRSAAPGKAGASGETHFRVEVVSEVFVGLSLVKRQRMVYGLLAPEFALGLHALSLDTRTAEEAARSA
ncbi:MAG: hypothetical protein WDW38_006812 [Sanguina aurantia]